MVEEKFSSVQFSAFQSSHSVVSDSSWPHESQPARPPCPSPTPGVHPDSLLRWKEGNTNILNRSKHLREAAESVGSAHLKQLKWSQRRKEYKLRLPMLSHSVVSDSVHPHRQQPIRLPRPWDSPGKNTGVGCHFKLRQERIIVADYTKSCSY